MKSRYLSRLKRKQNIISQDDRPRLCIFKSCKHFYLQLIDDQKGQTIFSTSTLEKKIKNNKDSIKILSDEIINFTSQNNIQKIVFDRNGFLYKEKIQLLAEELRKKLDF